MRRLIVIFVAATPLALVLAAPSSASRHRLCCWRVTIDVAGYINDQVHEPKTNGNDNPNHGRYQLRWDGTAYALSEGSFSDVSTLTAIKAVEGGDLAEYDNLQGNWPASRDCGPKGPANEFTPANPRTGAWTFQRAKRDFPHVSPRSDFSTFASATFGPPFDNWHNSPRCKDHLYGAVDALEHANPDFQWWADYNLVKMRGLKERKLRKGGSGAILCSESANASDADHDSEGIYVWYVNVRHVNPDSRKSQLKRLHRKLGKDVPEKNPAENALDPKIAPPPNGCHKAD